MITRKTRRGIVSLVLLTAVSYWIGRNQDIKLPEPVAGLNTKLNYVLHDFNLQFFDENGQPTLNMQAPELKNDPELELGTIEQPVIRVNRAGERWKLTSESATVTADKEHVRLSGHVFVNKREADNGNWVELDTRDVLVDVTPQTVSTDQAVSIFDGNNRLDATGLELDMKTDTFKLKQRVKASYAVN